MSIVSELASMPGVIAAGEYAYRGDRFSYKGDLEPEQARMASIMCRSTTMGVRMQADMLASIYPDCGITPSRGWAVRGPQFSVCVVANVFCFLSAEAPINDIMQFMTARLHDDVSDMV